MRQVSGGMVGRELLVFVLLQRTVWLLFLVCYTLVLTAFCTSLLILVLGFSVESFVKVCKDLLSIYVFVHLFVFLRSSSAILTQIFLFF